MPKYKYYIQPTQVTFKYKGKREGGIAYERVVINGRNGEKILIADLEEIRNMTWISISDEICGA